MTRFILTIVALILGIMPDLKAGDKATAAHVYEGRITGLFCGACAGKVKASLRKLAGVAEVKITSTSETGVQKVRIESSSADITKEAAILALGEDARSFTLLDLEKLQ
ncbi:copper chaperone CopZ [Roseimicrobium gellanilyticum]|uniref:Copper chaperone CopZ n=1 Tax=Roseimicrobium gellanilyticum TaxID=748857 RepID=A0A366HQF7_9BACT|nr:heavy-metal-associated domain-containing protein [Roseimicrobium gellanilyticum]RBP45905.1 copper chaperone CopZ [Roseimicrobium gellanilyticum]